MIQTWNKWRSGPYFPGCDCCRKGTRKVVTVACNRHDRRVVRQQLRGIKDWERPVYGIWSGDEFIPHDPQE